MSWMLRIATYSGTVYWSGISSKAAGFMRTIKHNLLQVHAVVRVLWPRMVKNKQTTTRFVMLTWGDVHVQVSRYLHIDTQPPLNGNTIFYMDSIKCRHHQWVKVCIRTFDWRPGPQRLPHKPSLSSHFAAMVILDQGLELTWSGSGEAYFSAFEAPSSLPPFCKRWSDAMFDQICGWTGQLTYRRSIQTASKK
jgi:hypothetical protein